MKTHDNSMTEQIPSAEENHKNQIKFNCHLKEEINVMCYDQLN